MLRNVGLLTYQLPGAGGVSRTAGRESITKMVLLRLLTTIVRLDCGKELHDICHALIGVMHLVRAGAELGSRVSQIVSYLKVLYTALVFLSLSVLPCYVYYDN